MFVDQRLAGQQSDAADHADQAARGVGAAAEAEHVDLVAGLAGAAGGVVQRQKAIRLGDVAEQPQTERAAEQPVDPVPAGADAADVVHELLNAVRYASASVSTVRAIFSMLVTFSFSGRFQVPSQQITIRFISGTPTRAVDGGPETVVPTTGFSRIGEPYTPPNP